MGALLFGAVGSGVEVARPIHALLKNLRGCERGNCLGAAVYLGEGRAIPHAMEGMACKLGEVWVASCPKLTKRRFQKNARGG